MPVVVAAIARSTCSSPSTSQQRVQRRPLGVPGAGGALQKRPADHRLVGVTRRERIEAGTHGAEPVSHSHGGAAYDEHHRRFEDVLARGAEIDLIGVAATDQLAQPGDERDHGVAAERGLAEDGVDVDVERLRRARGAHGIDSSLGDTTRGSVRSGQRRLHGEQGPAATPSPTSPPPQDRGRQGTRTD